MFVKFRNRLTGSIMWVADDRAEEYKAMGHKPVVDEVSAPEKPVKEPEVKKEPKAVEKKAPAKKTQPVKAEVKKAPAKKAAPKTAVLTNVAPETVEKVIARKETDAVVKTALGEALPYYLL